jgi:hypothetical protein
VRGIARQGRDGGARSALPHALTPAEAQAIAKAITRLPELMPAGDLARRALTLSPDLAGVRHLLRKFPNTPMGFERHTGTGLRIGYGAPPVQFLCSGVG